jgi:hypothetical protein
MTQDRELDKWAARLRDAHDRAPTAAVLEELKQRLLVAVNPTEQLVLLSLVGETGDASFAPFVEPYLSLHSHPDVAGKALGVLSTDLGLGEQYFEHLVALCQGVDWDVEHDAQLIALQAAGEYLRNKPALNLLELLIDLAEDESESDLLQRVAIDALARAIGRRWLDVGRNRDIIVAEAKQRLG